MAMALGVLDYVELAVVAVFAIPIGLLGVQFLVDGSTMLGAAFLALSVAMVLVKYFLPSPSDVPKEMAQQGAEAIVNDDTDAEE